MVQNKIKDENVEVQEGSSRKNIQQNHTFCMSPHPPPPPHSPALSAHHHFSYNRALAGYTPADEQVSKSSLDIFFQYFAKRSPAIRTLKIFAETLPMSPYNYYSNTFSSQVPPLTRTPSPSHAPPHLPPPAAAPSHSDNSLINSVNDTPRLDRSFKFNNNGNIQSTNNHSIVHVQILTPGRGGTGGGGGNEEGDCTIGGTASEKPCGSITASGACTSPFLSKTTDKNYFANSKNFGGSQQWADSIESPAVHTPTESNNGFFHPTQSTASNRNAYVKNNSKKTTNICGCSGDGVFGFGAFGGTKVHPKEYSATKHLIILCNALGIFFGLFAISGGIYLCSICLGNIRGGVLFNGQVCALEQKVGGVVGSVIGAFVCTVSAAIFYSGSVP